MSSSYSSSFLSLSPGAEHQIGGYKYNAGDNDDDDDTAVPAAVSSYLSCFDMDVVGEYYYPPEAAAPPAAVSSTQVAYYDCRNGESRREQSQIRDEEAGAVQISSPGSLSIDKGQAPANGAGGLPRSKSSKIAFKTRSEVDVLEDGYRWRKYGKKMVKNSPNPRNYYRCSSEGCRVKKRVERERDDARFVVTTYDGVHNHPAPTPTPHRHFHTPPGFAGPGGRPGLEVADEQVALFGSGASLPLP